MQILLAGATLTANLHLGGYRDFHAKALCCTGFVIMASVGLLYTLLFRHHRLIALLMALGAIAGYLGDVTLQDVVSVGTLYFAIGHIFYLFAFLRQRPEKKLLLCLWSATFAAAGAFILFHPHLYFPDLITRLVTLGYAAVISLMVSSAAAVLLRRKSFAAAFAFSGALLFFLSDLFLMLQSFFAGFSLPNVWSMSLYLLAQVALHFSTPLHNRPAD
ncbi:MAG: hypothetical protein IJN42_00810 [Clostridia bacterium]|nr:hypothetical protein [Clostridia bacterium]